MVTMRDVAKTAGVSRVTASRVFNNATTVKSSTREKVLTAARDLQYEPNAHAQRLARGPERVIGLVVSHVAEDFYGAIVTAIEHEARELGYRTVHACSYSDAFKEAEILRHFRSLRVSGILALPVMAPANDSLWNELDAQLPLVFVNQCIPACKHHVLSDDEKGAELVTTHLIASGTKPFCIGPHQDHPSQVLPKRKRGYEEAMRIHDMMPQHVPVTPAGDGLHLEDYGFAVTQAFLKKNSAPSALYCVNDRIALGAMHALQEHGIRPGVDVLVAGHGDLGFSAHTNPPLTTVRPPIEQMGSDAVHALDQLVSAKGKRVRKHRLVLNNSLIIRESSSLK